MKYFVNKEVQSSGSHQVHASRCLWIPDSPKRIFLGDFETSQEALEAAKQHFEKVNGCIYCCNPNPVK